MHMFLCMHIISHVFMCIIKKSHHVCVCNRNTAKTAHHYEIFYLGNAFKIMVDNAISSSICKWMIFLWCSSWSWMLSFFNQPNSPYHVDNNEKLIKILSHSRNWRISIMDSCHNENTTDSRVVSYIYIYIYIYVCVCVCVCECVCAYIYLYKCVCVRVYTNIYVCTRTYTYVCVNGYMHKYICHWWTYL